LLTASDDLGDDLVARYHIRTVHRQITLSHMKIGTAYPTSEHSHEQLVGSRMGRLFLYPTQGVSLHWAGLPHPPDPHR
jgi:hypothetical protein